MSFKKPLYPFPPIQPERPATSRASSRAPSSAPRYPQSWVQVEPSVEQLIIIVIFVLPLADDLVDSGGEANESWVGGGEVLTPRFPGSQDLSPLPLQPSGTWNTPCPTTFGHSATHHQS